MSGHIITCYSYKGGVGRTMAMANMAVLMALRGRRVLCVDWDLEAPGLHLYFQGEKAKVGAGTTGLLDLVEALATDTQTAWKPYVRPVKLDAPGKLDLLCAGFEGEDYVPRLQKLNWEQLYAEKGIGEAVERLREEWTEAYDVVLVDSRTGISDTGGICTIQIPDILVMFFTANDQSFVGSLNLARRVIAARQQIVWPRAALRILPVPSRFEGRVEYDAARHWLQRFATELEPLYGNWLHKDLKPEEILRFTRLPAIPHWGFGERLPILEEDRKDPDTLAFAYESVGVLLEKKLASSLELVGRRPDFVVPRVPQQVDFAFLGNVDDYVRKVVAQLRSDGATVRLWSEVALPGDRTEDASKKIASVAKVIVHNESVGIYQSETVGFSKIQSWKLGKSIVPLFHDRDERDGIVGVNKGTTPPSACAQQLRAIHAREAEKEARSKAAERARQQNVLKLLGGKRRPKPD